jgi:hypothetical protein
MANLRENRSLLRVSDVDHRVAKASAPGLPSLIGEVPRACRFRHPAYPEGKRQSGGARSGDPVRQEKSASKMNDPFI